MTHDEIRALAREAKERAGKASPGPWVRDGWSIVPSDAPMEVRCPGGCDGGCDDDPRLPDGEIRCDRVTHASEVVADVYGLQEFAETDGAFISHARTDIPALCAAIEQLLAEREVVVDFDAVPAASGKEQTP